MRTKSILKLISCFISIAIGFCAYADIVTLKSGEKLEGAVVRESDKEVVLRVGYSLLTFDRRDVQTVEKTEKEAEKPSTARLPTWRSCISVLFGKDWVKQFRQIPATVIDKGVLRYVPYKSFRSGNYEFNVYGDPDQPSCIEVGIYNDLLKDESAKRRCLDLMMDFLSSNDSKNVLKSLNLRQDKKEKDGLTFEVTPETADDAYGGWWISIYDEKMLTGQRASEGELKDITVERKSVQSPEPKAKAKTDEASNGSDRTNWTSDDLGYARSQSGDSPSSTSNGGSVYVRGYYRKDGTYVHSYTRSRPHR